MLGGPGEKERVGGRVISREGEGEAGGTQEEGGGGRCPQGEEQGDHLGSQ